MRLLKIVLRKEIDTDPDLSFLGEYSDKPGEKDRTIDRGDQKESECRYWIAANTTEDTGNPASVEEDYLRHEAWLKAEWQSMGVWAEATYITHQQGCVQKMRSGGAWGLDSDCTFFDETAQEELEELKEELKAIGFTENQIDAVIDQQRRNGEPESKRNLHREGEKGG